jgi:hypothetical protein
MSNTYVSQFRINLSRALAEAALMFDHITADSRIGPLLKVFMNISSVGIFTETSENKNGSHMRNSSTRVAIVRFILSRI